MNPIPRQTTVYLRWLDVGVHEVLEDMSIIVKAVGDFFIPV
jgi:hypothetical protein